MIARALLNERYVPGFITRFKQLNIQIIIQADIIDKQKLSKFFFEKLSQQYDWFEFRTITHSKSTLEWQPTLPSSQGSVFNLAQL